MLVVPIIVGLGLLLGGAVYLRRTRKNEALISGEATHTKPKLPAPFVKWEPNPVTEGEWAEFAPIGPNDRTLFPWPAIGQFWKDSDVVAFVAMCGRLNLPVNAAGLVLRSESGLNPTSLLKQPIYGPDKKTVIGYKYAAGLCQLTVGANRPGYQTQAAVLEFSKKPISEQLKVIEPFWAAMPIKAKMSPTRMYMCNFLPALAWKPLDFVLARRDDKSTLPGGLSRHDVWASNPGFDPGGKRGYFTIGDIHAHCVRLMQNDAKAAGKAVA